MLEIVWAIYLCTRELNRKPRLFMPGFFDYKFKSVTAPTLLEATNLAYLAITPAV